MKPLMLKMAEFGPYRCKKTANGYEPKVIDFRAFGGKGIVLVTGDTGAGKTTIYDAISYALYGVASGEYRQTNSLRSQNAPADSPTYVELTFCYRNTEYTVYRQPEYERSKKKGAGTTTEKAHYWLKCGNQTIAEGDEVKKEVVRIIGLTQEQFSRIMMIAQGEFLKLLMVPTSKRQEIMRELFHTERYEALAKELKNRRDTLIKGKKDEQEQLEKHISNIQFPEGEAFAGDAALLRENRLTADEQLALFERIIEADETEKSQVEEQIKEDDAKKESAVKKYQVAEDTAKKKSQLAQALTDIEAQQKALEELEHALTQAKAEEPKIQPYRDEAAKLEQQMPAYDEVQKSVEGIAGLESDAQEKQKDCDKAEKDAETAANALADMQKEQTELRDAKTELQGIQHKLENLRNNDKQKVQNLRELLDTYQKLRSQLETAQESFQAAQTKYHAASHAYDEKFNCFLANQAGLIASRLHVGDTCPVCGNVCKAIPQHTQESIVTEKELEQFKKQKEDAEKQFSQRSSNSKSAKDRVSDKAKELLKNAAELFAFETAENPEVPVQEIDAKLTEEEKRLYDEEKELIQAETDAERKSKRLDELNDSMPKQEKKRDDAKELSESLKNEVSKLDATIQTMNKELAKKRDALPYPEQAEAQKRLNFCREEAQRFEDAIKQAEQNLINAKQTISKLEGSIDQLQKDIENAPEIDLKQAQEEKRQIEERLNASNGRCKVLIGRISFNRSQCDAVRDIIHSISAKDKELNILERLYITANGVSEKSKGKDSSDSMKVKLETYVLAGYLDRILVFANQRLTTMTNGHYRMRRATEKRSGGGYDGLEINVIDTWAGDAERAVHSLSGGEGFMASMALALGFAEVIQHSAGGIQLDSMFIDEGFGTLDSDTLAQSMRVLADLSSGDRLIGLISHVSELKNRIDKQIIVKKDHSGASSLEFQT